MILLETPSLEIDLFSDEEDGEEILFSKKR